jgi:multiple sugar transport system ATP-binding protein
MADRIVVMKDGKIQQIGSPLHLYNFPANKFVAGFIGSPPMNFLSVNVTESVGAIVLEEEAGGFRLEAAAEHVQHLKNYVGKKIFFGIRPEDIVYQGDDASKNSMPLKVTVVEPLGADITLWLTINGQSMVARTEPRHNFSVDQSVNFVPKMEKARYFDRDTELAILPAGE